MTRSVLVARLAEIYPHLPRDTVERLVSVFFSALTEQLVTGGRVELRGFGSFSTKARGARVARDPRSGRPVDGQATRVPAFRPAAGLKKALNARFVERPTIIEEPTDQAVGTVRFDSSGKPAQVVI